MGREIHQNNKHDQLTADTYFFKNVRSRLLNFAVSADTRNYQEAWFLDFVKEILIV